MAQLLTVRLIIPDQHMSIESLFIWFNAGVYIVAISVHTYLCLYVTLILSLCQVYIKAGCNSTAYTKIAGEYVTFLRLINMLYKSQFCVVCQLVY